MRSCGCILLILGLLSSFSAAFLLKGPESGASEARAAGYEVGRWLLPVVFFLFSAFFFSKSRRNRLKKLEGKLEEDFE